MAESRTVTLSPGANAAVETIASNLNLAFEDALSLAIGTQAEIAKQIKAGNRVSVSPDGKSLRVTIPG